MRRRRAFTLIELLVVVAIIGILATVVVVSFSGAQVKAKDAKIKAEMVQLQKFVQIYGQDNGGYTGVNCSLSTTPCEALSGGSLDQAAKIASSIKLQNNTGVTIFGGANDFQATTNLVSKPEIFMTATFSGTGTSDTGSIVPRVANRFTAVNGEYLKVTKNSSFDLAGKSFEWAVWVYPTSSSTQNIIGKRDDALGTDYSLSVSNYYANFATDAGVYDNLIGTTQLTPNTWNLVTFGYIYSSSQKFITVTNTTNSTPVMTPGVARSISISNNKDLLIGAGWRNNQPINLFDGNLDSVGYWTKVLSTSERQDLYYSGKGQTYSNIVSTNLNSSLVSWWDLNESTGLRYDSKGNNDLTPAGQVLIDGSARNGNFETGNFANWSLYTGTNANSGGTPSINSTNPISGNKDVKIVMSSAPVGGAGILQTILSANKRYRTTFKYMRTSSSGAFRCYFDTGGGYGKLITPTESNKIFTDSCIGNAANSNNYFAFYSWDANSVFQLDDITLEETGNPSNIIGVGANL